MKKMLFRAAGGNIALICASVFALSVLFVPHFAAAGNLRNLLLCTCLFGIVTVGAAFTLLTGAVDFSIGYQVALCSLLACVLSRLLGFWLGAAVTILIGGAVGLFNALAINLLCVNPMAVTLGTMMLLRGAAEVLSDSMPISCSDAVLSGLFSYNIGGILPLPALLFALILAGGHVFLRRTKTGISFYVIGGNADAGYAAGIGINSVRAVAFVLSGFLAALGGILFASRLSTGTVSIGESMTIDILSSCIIGGISISGGKGSLFRMLFGVFLIQLVGNLMSLFAMPASFQLFFTGAVLIFVLIIDRAARAKGQRRVLL